MSSDEFSSVDETAFVTSDSIDACCVDKESLAASSALRTPCFFFKTYITAFSADIFALLFAYCS